MSNKDKEYITKGKRIMHFEVGSIILAMIKCQEKYRNSKVSYIAKELYKDEVSKIDINRVSKILDSINDGIVIEGKKVYSIIEYIPEPKIYLINYPSLFRLFLETLVEYPLADRPIPHPIMEGIQKDEPSFVRFIREYANKFNFEDQEWALFELGQTICYACSLYSSELKNNTKSPWYKLGVFILDNIPSLKESVKALKSQ